MGKVFSSTSFLYSASLCWISTPKLPYRFACFGEKSPYKPNISWYTWIWPSQKGPAPIPMVGISNKLVIFAYLSKYFYSKAGVESNTFNFKKAIVALPLQSGTGPVILLP